MKIAFIPSTFLPNIGGAEIQAHNVANKLVEEGHEVDIFLLNKVNNQNVLLETFYPNLKELGFEGAFNLSFGYSTSEFYNEFYEFLQLPIEQQLEIIPDI